MKQRWLENQFAYDGSQLRCQYAYLNHGVLGDSIVSWVGRCDIKPDHMADGEDLLAGAEIRGSQMLHFIIEIFEQRLFAGVALQRLFASVVRDEITHLRAELATQLRRDGDDLYVGDRKLSISVAAQSPLSVVIHFALNISNEGTPVPTCALSEWQIEAKTLSMSVMQRFVSEWQSIREATVKVKPV